MNPVEVQLIADLSQHHLPQRLANLNPKPPRPGDAPSLQKPERGRRLDQWLLDLGQVMAGLERWRDASKETNR
jgi:hypothetical protein